MSKRKEPKSWRCYHCDEVFYCPSAAAEHFGPSQKSRPLCQVSRTTIEELELQLRRYRNEDTDLHRQIANMEGKHQTELRAEESGYAKGLRDGRAMVETI